jgi:hypothetical protein
MTVSALLACSRGYMGKRQWNPATCDLAELDAKISELQGELRELRRVRSARLRAECPTPRKRRISDDDLWRLYKERGGRTYGALRETAAAAGLSMRHTTRLISRIARTKMSWPSEDF